VDDGDVAIGTVGARAMRIMKFKAVESDRRPFDLFFLLPHLKNGCGGMYHTSTFSEDMHNSLDSCCLFDIHGQLNR